MHAEEFVLTPKRLFMTKQPLKSKILDNPAYRNKAAQLTLMQKNMPSSEDSVERTDGVDRASVNRAGKTSRRARKN